MDDRCYRCAEYRIEQEKIMNWWLATIALAVIMLGFAFFSVIWCVV